MIQFMKTPQERDGSSVSVCVENDENLDSVLDAFKGFLQACTYPIDSDEYVAIIEDKCVECTACVRVCPVDCISGTVKKPHVIDQDKCISCGACYDVCKFAAVEKP